MTLHDRIMAIIDGPCSGDDSWVDGHVSAVEEAADIATEADELMARMAEALKVFADCCEHIRSEEDGEEWAKMRLIVSDYRKAQAAYNAYKEQ